MTSGRKRRSTTPPRQARSRATVDAVLEAAARVVARDGYAKARMAVIAKRAGVSVGSIYQYYASKEALVEALVRYHIQRGWELFLRRIGELGALSIRDAVRAVIACAVEAYLLDPALSKVIFEQVPRAHAGAGLPDFHNQLVGVLSSHLAGHAERVRPQRLALAARILVISVVEVMAALTAADPSLSEREAIVEELSDLAVRYLLDDPPVP